MKPTVKAVVLVEIELSGEVQDLLDKIAGRVYSMDKVENVTISAILPQKDQ